MSRHQLGDAAELRELIRQHLLEILQATERPLLARGSPPPAVVMMVGVNGAGKHTSIGAGGPLSREVAAFLLCAADTISRRCQLSSLRFGASGPGYAK